MTADELLKTAEDMLGVLGRIDTQAVRSELEKLRGIREWAMKNLGVDYAVGDKVVLTRSLAPNDPTHGWYVYREALAAGAVATVRRIEFAAGRADESGWWYVEIRLDREWSVHDGWGISKGEVRRYWSGPVDETPEGMTASSLRDTGDNRHVFMVRTSDIRKAPPTEPKFCECCGHELCMY